MLMEMSACIALELDFAIKIYSSRVPGQQYVSRSAYASFPLFIFANFPPPLVPPSLQIFNMCTFQEINSEGLCWYQIK